ncbi:MAG: two-component regulator propeller domain-containing protein, partial [Bacteroidota bacterium]
MKQQLKFLPFLGSCLFLVLVFSCPAQSPTLQFAHLALSDGLAHSNVSCIKQDQSGYVWIGTFNGLSRYDASSMKNFLNQGDSTSLCRNNVSSLALSNDKSLYVGMTDCINKYLPDSRSFQPIEVVLASKAPSRFSVSKMVPAKNGDDMWVSTMGAGLLHLDGETQTAIPQDIRVNNELVTRCFGLMKDEQEKLWIGCANEVLVFSPINRSVEQLFFYEGEKRLSLVGDVGTIIRDSKGQIWAGTNNKGIFKYHPVRNRFESFVYPDGQKRTFATKIMAEDPNGQIWIGTDGEGLFVLTDSHVAQYFHDEGNPSSIGSSTIYSIFHGEDGTTWIGHFGGGVSIYNANSLQFNTITKRPKDNNSLTNSNVRSLYQATDKTIWIGTRGGLSALDEVSWTFKRYPYEANSRYSPSAPIILTILEDAQADLWIGTFGGGLNVLNRKTGIFTYFQIDDTQPNGITDNNVYSLLDLDTNLLVGTLGNLHLFDKQTQSFEVIEGINFVKKMVQTQDETIWLGTDHGLYTYDVAQKKPQKVWPDRDGWNDIHTIYEARNGTLWLGVSGLGLIKMQNGKVDKIYGEKEGLPSNTVTSILEDTESHLWLSTYNGLAQFDPKAEAFRTFDLSDGIQGLEYNSSAALLSTSGKMYFGGIAGMDQFDPNKIRYNKIPPSIFINKLQISKGATQLDDVGYLQQSIQSLSEVVFDPDVDRFSFQFSVLNYTAPQKNRTAYRLVGYDEQWRQTTAPHTATYTNVPAGKYTLEVKAANNDGIWNPTVKNLDITVEPPIWKTWYAIVGYIAGIIGLILWFNHTTLVNSKYKNQLRIAELEAKKRTEINQMKLAFFTNISHELRTPLTLILSPLERLISATTHDHPNVAAYQLIRRNAKRLLELVNQLMDFRKIENHRMQLRCRQGDLIAYLGALHANFNDLAQHQKIQYHYFHEVDKLTCWFDKDAVEKIIYNLLSNAFKFTPTNGTIQLFVTLEKTSEASAKIASHLKIIVKNTGKAIEPAQVSRIFDRFYVEPQADKPFKGDTGIGLALVKSIVELSQGKIWVESEAERGTRFHVVLPLTYAPFTDPTHRMMFEESRPLTYKTRLQPQPMERAIIEPIRQKLNGDHAIKKAELPKLLLVEDNPDILNFIQNELQAHFQIHTASDGVMGFEVAKRVVPDLILSDVMMPNMDG